MALEVLSSLNDLRRWLDYRLTVGESQDTDRQIFFELTRKLRIQDLLRSITDNEREVRDIASQSYGHANGFDKIVLLTSTEPEYKLRLHIWWPNEGQKAAVTYETHNHRWDFNTMILVGSYRHQVFRHSMGGEDFYHYKYFPRGREERYELVLTNMIKLEKVSDSIVARGMSYRMPHDISHRIVSVEDGVTASLVLQGPSKTQDTDVFSIQQLGSIVKKDSPTIAPRVLHQKLRAFLSLT